MGNVVLGFYNFGFLNGFQPILCFLWHLIVDFKKKSEKKKQSLSMDPYLKIGSGQFITNP